MSLPLFLLFGFVVGLLARALLPGNQKMGLLRTTALGVAGSFTGGLLGNLVYGRGAWNQLNATGLVGSVIGAMVLLILVRIFSSRCACVSLPTTESARRSKGVLRRHDARARKHPIAKPHRKGCCAIFIEEELFIAPHGINKDGLTEVTSGFYCAKCQHFVS